MRVFGEICLLTCLVASGYAAFLSLLGGRDGNAWRPRLAASTAVVGFAALSVTLAILAWALVSRDFSYEYVANYSSRLLPWQYRFSALWVGQAGSLLLWAWMMGALALALRFLPTVDSLICRTAFGLVMGNVCFLVAVMVFAADPMAASLTTPTEGTGLSPLLHHPNMLIHPPIVFLSYAAWSVPCALALAALGHGRLDATWTQMARPWAISAWMLLGVGLLLGAQWAYQELGWGGYWGWDPVENGSLLPWLTGTALIHSMLAWRHRDALKKAAVSLAVVTFGLCNFATFLTRSGIFSSVHAFSESPIGWMFLALMGGLLIGGAVLLVRRRDQLAARQALSNIFARETLILVSTFLLVSLAIVVMVGTLVAPLTKMYLGRMIQVGPAFYNNVLPPIGLGLLATTAAVPLLQWGAPPAPDRRRLLACCLAVSLAVVVAALVAGMRQPLLLAVVGMAAMTVATWLAAWLHDAWQRQSHPRWHGLLGALRSGRRKYAAYSVHLGFVCVAIGVTGSSLGTQRKEVTLDEGDTLHWANRQIHYVRLEQRQLPDKLVAEAVLQIARDGSAPIELRPARHLHLLQNDWTTEVAIDSTWRGDFYTVLHAGLGDGRVVVTLVDNPMIGWIWGGGVVATVAAILALWPVSRRRVEIADLACDPHGTSLLAEPSDSRASAA
jgi:cytochrome c-type biogenesis protein CcmF